MSEEKQLIIEYNGIQYQRIPVKTKVIVTGDDIASVVAEFVAGKLEAGDLVFISEKAVACSQGRSIPLTEIKPGFWAKRLSKYVTRTPHGIGLGMPETMEMAIQECGLPKILAASCVGAVGKLLGRKGDFYRVAGDKAASIDGPTPYTIAPYNKCVTLGPKDPDKVAKVIAAKIGAPVAIVDINDLGGKVLGASFGGSGAAGTKSETGAAVAAGTAGTAGAAGSPGAGEWMDRDSIVGILKDNPLGQGSQQTPLGIIRRA
ncbi:MAG: coenzyme F420-0:L-glutamate ligase [Bacillota bacterium]